MAYTVEYNPPLSSDARELITECISASSWNDDTGIYSSFNVEDLLLDNDLPKDLKIIQDLLKKDIDYIEI